MESLQEYDYEIVYVQGNFNVVVADAMSRINGSPSSELYTGEEEEEAAEAVALNVVGTVSRPMLTNYMLSEVLRAYKADKSTRKDFEILKRVDLRNLQMVYCKRLITGKGSWLCHRESYDKP
jgi:hypothetical protein